MPEQLYYMQDRRQCVGNSMLWWAKDCRGYVCDIRKAEVFTMEEALANSHRDSDVLWPKEFIDDRISYHIDMQHCRPVQGKCINMEEANKAVEPTYTKEQQHMLDLIDTKGGTTCDQDYT